jgi:iron(III) transport system ATP-binding protein
MADATLVEGSLHAAGFTASNHPCAVGHDVLGTRFRSGEEGTLAVLPEDVRLDADSAGAAAVTSSLFGRSGNDVIVDWAGVRVRCRVTGRRPLVGERVTVAIQRALFYPAASLAVREDAVR